LETKVLDMGMGHERIVWMMHGSETSYEANMKQVVEQLYEQTGVDPDEEIWRKFLPYAGHLNLDEVDDIDETWQEIANEIDVPVDELKEEVLPAAALYAIADHTRCLLVALNDGLLPSNSGERHSLRVMARRCMEFIDKYDWDVALTEVLEWHADEFGALYPELQENLNDIKQIMLHEETKYDQMKKDASRIIDDLDTDNITDEKLVELYDSHGITPEMLQRHGIDVEQPANFYQLVSERHADESGVPEEDEMDRVDVQGEHETERLYFEDEYMQEFEAEVVEVIDQFVVLDKTAFYPTSGGQEHDTGYMNDSKVVDVIDQEGVILHQIQSGDAVPDEGATVQCAVDWERRTKHRKHHTATHIVNTAAKNVLGDHIWQAGAHKTVEKGRLDITHYEKLDDATLQEIEEDANRIVNEDLPVEKKFVPRTDAEREHGFRIYQGGAVPGKTIRIVRIGDDIDVEACGGTHVTRTGEVGTIRLINTTKVQDGTIRLEYVAGEAAEEHEQVRDEIRDAISGEVATDMPLEDIADIFSVETEQLPRIVERFVEEWQNRADEINGLKDRIDAGDDEAKAAALDEMVYDERPRDPQTLFDEWKQQEKDIDTLQEFVEEQVRTDLLDSDDTVVREQIATDDVGMLIRTAKHVVNQQPEKAVILVGDNAVVGAAGDDQDRDMDDAVSQYAETVQGDADFAKGFQLKQGRIKKV
jgi:alanyl-tRNA synthetase